MHTDIIKTHLCAGTPLNTHTYIQIYIFINNIVLRFGTKKKKKIIKHPIKFGLHRLFSHVHARVCLYRASN